MSWPLRASFRQSTAFSHRWPLLVTPTICLAISAGLVLPASCVASAVMTTASYASAE